MQRRTPPLGSQANARFLAALGIDPRQVTSDSLEIDIVGPDMIVVYWHGMKTVTLEAMEYALDRAGDEK